MAGLGYKNFTTGDVLTAGDVDNYLMEQTVMVFADAAARTTALTSVLSEGMISYLKDTNSTEYYSGSAWAAIGGAGGGMTLLSTTAMSGSTLTVSSISQAYKHLLVIAKDIYGSTNDAGGDIRFNGDTGSNYTFSSIRMDNTTPSYEAGITTELSNAMFSNPSTNTATKLGSVVVNIYRYTETSTIVGDLQSISTKDDSAAMSSRMPFSYNASAGITSISFNTNTGTFSGGNVYIYGVN